MKTIQKVIETNVFENGEIYEFMNYPEYDSDISLNIFNNLLLKNEQITALEKKIIYSDGSEYILPIAESVHVLLDCKCFLIIFNNQPSKLSKKIEYPWYFLRPNNAAVYNSDGSLRHQLIIPKDLINLTKIGKEDWYIHSPYYGDFPNFQGFGVMVTNDLYWPDLCFCIYDGTPNLIWTEYTQARR